MIRGAGIPCVSARPAVCTLGVLLHPPLMLIEGRRNTRQWISRGGKGQDINGRPGARSKRHNLLLAPDDMEVAQSDPGANPKAKAKAVSFKRVQKDNENEHCTTLRATFKRKTYSP
jgi:hypothetical protein